MGGAGRGPGDRQPLSRGLLLPPGRGERAPDRRSGVTVGGSARIPEAQLLRPVTQSESGVERDLHDGAQIRFYRCRPRRTHFKASHWATHADPALEEALDRGIRGSEGRAPRAPGAGSRDPSHVLTHAGLAAAVQSLAGIPLGLLASVDVESAERYAAPVEGTAYFVVSEALANVSKYAEGLHASVRIERNLGELLVEVSDDGIGDADPSRGSGLSGLIDRPPPSNWRSNRQPLGPGGEGHGAHPDLRRRGHPGYPVGADACLMRRSTDEDDPDRRRPRRVPRPGARLLEADGFSVVGEASDGASCSAPPDPAPDIVLLDIGLPDIEGFEVARELALGDTPPVVVLTSSRLADEYTDRVQRSGVAASSRKRSSPAPPSGLSSIAADDAPGSGRRLVLLREGMARLLSEAGFEVAAQAADLPSLIAAVRQHHPDVAIVDIRMPPTYSDEGLRAAEAIRLEHGTWSASSSSPSTRRPHMPSGSWQTAPEAWATSSRTGSRTSTTSRTRSGASAAAGPSSTPRSSRSWSPGGPGPRRSTISHHASARFLV